MLRTKTGTNLVLGFIFALILGGIVAYGTEAFRATVLVILES